MIISGYKMVSYEKLIALLREYRKYNKITNVKIANSLDIKCTQTIVNAFNGEFQQVKDKILTGIMQCLEFDGMIIWRNGKRLYFIKKKIS